MYIVLNKKRFEIMYVLNDDYKTFLIFFFFTYCDGIEFFCFVFVSFWVNDELFFGVDYFYFVERVLGNELVVF